MASQKRPLQYILYYSGFSFGELAGSRELSVTPHAGHVAIKPLFGLENLVYNSFVVERQQT
jgi:hypothetical protein